MSYTATFDNDYTISTDSAKMDVDKIHAYLNTSYWAEGISREVVEKAIANSLCFGIFYNEEQVGFARVVTDQATFAYLADVFVLPEHRGKGLSKWMMEIIHTHPGLQGLRRWILATRDAHGLYEQFGWTRFTEDVASRLMQKHDPNVYKGRQD